MNELPVLDEVRCTGCSECTVVCPTECLAMSGPLPWLPRPVDCISCRLCEWICPADAIKVGPTLHEPRNPAP